MLSFFSIQETVSTEIINTISKITEVKSFIYKFLANNAKDFIESEYQLTLLKKSLTASINKTSEFIQQDLSVKKKQKLLRDEIRNSKTIINTIAKVLLDCAQFEPPDLEVNLDLLDKMFFNSDFSLEEIEDHIVRLFKEKRDDNEIKLKESIKKNQQEIVNLTRLVLNDYSSNLEPDFIVEKMIAHFENEFQKQVINAELNLDLWQRYKNGLNPSTKLNNLVGLQISIIENLYETTSYRLEHLEKRKLLNTVKKPNHPAEVDLIQFYAENWERLIRIDENEALDLINYFISFVLQPETSANVDNLIHPIQDLDDLALFFIKITNLAKEHQQKLIILIIETMGNQVFDLINAHFQHEKGPAGRENSVAAGLITHLILNNKQHIEFIVKSIEPLVTIMNSTATKQKLAESDFNQFLETAFKTIFRKLFTISDYSPEVQRIIHDFSKKNPERTINYLSIRIINPVISNYMETVKNEPEIYQSLKK